MQHLPDFVFVSMANATLARRDAYLDHLRSGIKQDTFKLAALWHLATLFMDSVLKKAEDKSPYMAMYILSGTAS